MLIYGRWPQQNDVVSVAREDVYCGSGIRCSLGRPPSPEQDSLDMIAGQVFLEYEMQELRAPLRTSRIPNQGRTTRCRRLHQVHIRINLRQTRPQIRGMTVADQNVVGLGVGMSQA